MKSMLGLEVKFLIICAVIFSTIQSLWADTIVTPYGQTNGRIKTVSAGLIVLKENGSEVSYRREVNNDYFDDTITYKKYFFSRKSSQLSGRVESLDRISATVYTAYGKFEIARYKIKDIIMKVPYKG